MEHADDIVRLALPHGQARIGAADDLVENVGGRRVAVDHLHGLAVGHHRADLDILEVENAVEHVALVLDHRAFFRLQRDGAAKLLLGGARLPRCLAGPGGAEGGGDDQPHRPTMGESSHTMGPRTGATPERHTVGIADA